MPAGSSRDAIVKLVGDIVEFVQQAFQITLNEEEWLYLMIHIERVTRKYRRLGRTEQSMI